MVNEIKTITTELLIIGAGGAGLRAAIAAAESGVQVCVVTKEALGDAHTTMAMGGVNVAIKPPATTQKHFADTLKGGWYINNQKLVDIFTREMPERIADLERYGVRFDRLPDGTLYTWAGGKQSTPLNLCAGDYTGWEMMQGLVREARKRNVLFFSKHFATKLFLRGNAKGGFFFEIESGKYKVIVAKAVIIAAGGAGQLFQITSNAPGNTGEGYAWALDAGIPLIDMEMIQFHPTGIAYPEHLRGELVTEKVRGHFGVLKNVRGERFMKKYQPKLKELAGRDEVTRAIYQEIQEGRGTKNGGVYLDTTHWEEGKAEKVIPDVFATFMKEGIDIRKDQMEISPTMHHVMGGIHINEWGETNIQGVFAAGEVTGGIHGANRLGGNSLGEGQVFGRRAGMRAARFVKKSKRSTLQYKYITEEKNRLERILNKKRGVGSSGIRAELQRIMWKKVGIIRSRSSLHDAMRKIRVLKSDLVRGRAKNPLELQFLLETQEMLKVADMITISALARTESRGAHYRSDYPSMQKKWDNNIVIQKVNGDIKTNIHPLVTLVHKK